MIPCESPSSSNIVKPSRIGVSPPLLFAADEIAAMGKIVRYRAQRRSSKRHRLILLVVVALLGISFPPPFRNAFLADDEYISKGKYAGNRCCDGQQFHAPPPRRLRFNAALLLIQQSTIATIQRFTPPPAATGSRPRRCDSSCSNILSCGYSHTPGQWRLRVLPQRQRSLQCDGRS